MSASSSSNPSLNAPVERRDVVVVGAGVVGLATALALSRGLDGAVSVTVCDPALGRPVRDDGRAFALAAGPRRMLETLGAWEGLAAEAQPIHAMIVTDSRVSDPVRPVFLGFDGDVAEGEPFAHMVSHAALLTALTHAARAGGAQLLAQGVAGVDRGPDRATVTLSDGSILAAKLVVGCDGARSRLREEAGIGVVRWDYAQSGIVALIGHERDHEGRAEEHFLPSGPFAILPMTGRRSSIVWSERSENVPALLTLDDEDLLAEIERRFGLHLGRLTLLTRPMAHPLSLMLARDFTAPRLALVGDAAHVIHPIAGQGLNMGFRDAAALAEAMAETVRLGLDPGGADVLTAYQRARRFDTAVMAVVTDGLNRLFATDMTPVRVIRDVGLGLVDRLPSLKRLMIREAAGLASSVPRLLKGELL